MKFSATKHVVRSFHSSYSKVVTEQFVFQLLKFRRQYVHENISIEAMKQIVRVIENLKTMKNNTPSGILQVYRPRILTDQCIDVGQHSRTMAQSLINIRVVPRFYRTNKFSVLWIHFSGSSNRVHGRLDYIPLWCPGDDAWMLGLLY